MNQTNIKTLLIFLFALFIISCTTQSESVKATQTSTIDSKQEIVSSPIAVNNQPTAETALDKNSIQNTKGVIVLSDHYGKNDFVRIYNEDGSLWYEFTYYYEDKNERFERKEDFVPFAFHPDYFSLALKCVAQDKSRYEVIVNEETGMRKFVKKDDLNLKFETLENHILNTFSVDFNKKENLLLDAPNGRVKKVEVALIERFEPIELKGEWLKVRWSAVTNRKARKKTDFGWIKWKEDDKFLIELFYMA
jgi:hypothetical protein